MVDHFLVLWNRNKSWNRSTIQKLSSTWAPLFCEFIFTLEKVTNGIFGVSGIQIHVEFLGGCSNTFLPRQLVPRTSLSLRSANSLPLACRNSKFSSSYRGLDSRMDSVSKTVWQKRAKKATGIFNTQNCGAPKRKIWIWNKRMIPIVFWSSKWHEKIVAWQAYGRFVHYVRRGSRHISRVTSSCLWLRNWTALGDYISYGAKLPLLHCRLGPCSLYKSFCIIRSSTVNKPMTLKLARVSLKSNNKDFK